MPGEALRVAIVGAESTGKSRLAASLAATLESEFGLRCACVDETLRAWCDEHGRTPRPDEQAGIARVQQQRIDAAAADGAVDLVVCDTTPLMTAVYSDLLFDDRSLDEMARAAQRGADITLLTALDLPWVPDGLQRDGPHVREPVDAAVRRRLMDWGIEWALVTGLGDARTANAVDAVRPLLRARARAPGAGPGLFSRLLGSRIGPAAMPWICGDCDQPDCEHRALASTRRR